MLPVLPDDRSRRFEANADGTALVDKGALGGNAPDDILGGQYRCHPVTTLGTQPRPLLNPLSTAAEHFGAVIPEIDIWRAAQLMLKRYGERALEESAARADELALAGDDDGATTWRRIMAAVTQLANKTPPGPLTGILYVIIRCIACMRGTTGVYSHSAAQGRNISQ